MLKNVEDYELIKMAVSGDQNAFSQLLNRYKNLVYSVVLRMVNDAEEANDLAQEIFIKLYKKICTIAREKNTLADDFE